MGVLAWGRMQQKLSQLPSTNHWSGSITWQVLSCLNVSPYLMHYQQAHALTPLLTTPIDQLPKFPFLTLLISGGHTLLLLATSKTEFRVLATTVDESIGRSFDKVARLLGLAWGTKGLGATLEELCLKDIAKPPDVGSFSVPMPGKLAFSYSCLHSSIERYITSARTPLTEPHKVALARAFQDAAARQLCAKLILGFKQLAMRDIKPKHVVVSGGVASNSFLREK